MIVTHFFCLIQQEREYLEHEKEEKELKHVLRGKTTPPHIEKVCFRKFVLLI